MTIGSFILIKNEIQWIEAHLKSWLPFLDRMVFLDGNSMDGTYDILDKAAHHSDHVILVPNKDPKDLREDYVQLFDEALRTLDTDLAFFLHPDMIHLSGGERLRRLNSDGLAWFTHMESFAGDPGGQLYKISSGRMEPWKNIMRLKNPDLGLHYHGFYGAGNEDMYFRDITGDMHEHHGDRLESYPFPVIDSGVKIAHFSDVRTFERRLSRMKTCLLNQGYSESEAQVLAKAHPRVTLLDGMGFKFESAEWPEAFRVPRGGLGEALVGARGSLGEAGGPREALRGARGGQVALRGPGDPA